MRSDAQFLAAVRDHRRRLRAVARQYGRTAADADDLVQEMLLRACGVGRFVVGLRTVAREWGRSAAARARLTCWGDVGLAAALVYLLLVALFRSFVDPLMVMFAAPLALIGVLLTLWVTHTALDIQSRLGVLFMVGIAVSNSVLLVESRLSAFDAAVRAAKIRLRPIAMTSPATVLGLLPMAIGRGSEANLPLARAVVGGLTASTVLVLFVMPVIHTLVHRHREAA